MWWHLNIREFYFPQVNAKDFGDMDLEKLIKAVRSFRATFDVSHMCYRDNRARENAWKKVALEVRNIMFV